MLTTNWNDAVLKTVDAGGEGLSPGGDPLIDTGGASGLQSVWSGAVVPTPGGMETANASGLPLQPSRFEPSGTPPAPPSLQDRNPGTID